MTKIVRCLIVRSNIGKNTFLVTEQKHWVLGNTPKHMWWWWLMNCRTQVFYEDRSVPCAQKGRQLCSNHFLKETVSSFLLWASKAFKSAFVCNTSYSTTKSFFPCSQSEALLRSPQEYSLQMLMAEMTHIFCLWGEVIWRVRQELSFTLEPGLIFHQMLGCCREVF